MPEATPPVHRDAGAYSLVYRKRFVKRQERQLRIERPQAENLTGRQAYERAAQILAETHQVLFFTCHPEVVEVFRGHKGDVPVYGVGSGEIKAGA